MQVGLEDAYQIKTEIGRGATAIVYLASHQMSLQQVALKQMRLAPDLSSDIYLQLSTRFLQEGKTLARLSHPHIPKALESGIWQGVPTLVMELIEGQKIYDFIQAQPRLDSLVRYLAEIADALDYAHQQGVVHRDIKPDNLIITEQRGAFLMDFGVARESESALHTSDGTMLGTIAYMAPEQLYNSAKADARCDIYSLGVVMYELFTGQLPFDGNSPAAMILKIFNSEPTPPQQVMPELPDALAELIMACLQKDADARIQRVGEITRVLKQLAKTLAPTQLTLGVNSSEPQPTLTEGSQLHDSGNLQALCMQLADDGTFQHYGLLLALDQAMIDGFSGAIKVKARQADQRLWFKGVIWLDAGSLVHALLIRDSLGPQTDLESLLSTAEGVYTATAHTPYPLQSWNEQDSRQRLRDLAQQLGANWPVDPIHAEPSADSQRDISYLYTPERILTAQRSQMA